jgi:hypothetical protein
MINLFATTHGSPDFLPVIDVTKEYFNIPVLQRSYHFFVADKSMDAMAFVGKCMRQLVTYVPGGTCYKYVHNAACFVVR